MCISECACAQLCDVCGDVADIWWPTTLCQQPEGHLQGILAYLSGRQISEACSLAQDAGDDRLALLLAQAAGSDVTRQMVAVQLAKWAEMEVRGNFQPAEVFFCAVFNLVSRQTWREKSLMLVFVVLIQVLITVCSSVVSSKLQWGMLWKNCCQICLPCITCKEGKDYGRTVGNWFDNWF